MTEAYSPVIQEGSLVVPMSGNVCQPYDTCKRKVTMRTTQHYSVKHETLCLYV